MKSPELMPFTDEPMVELDFELEVDDFDINDAFQRAVVGVVTDQELELDEKVRRMEAIVTEGTSEVYREFVDFRQMASQMEMMCSHDHTLGQSILGSSMLGGFMDIFGEDDGHGHAGNHAHDHNKDSDSASAKKEKGKKKTKKKKKKLGALGIFHLL